MGRQLADLWLRSRDSPPPHDIERASPYIKRTAVNLLERRLPRRLDLLALLSALRRRLLASDRPHLPRSVCLCLQLHESQAEAHAEKCPLLSGQGCLVLHAFSGD